MSAEGAARIELGRLAKFRSGGTPDRATAHLWNGGFPWLSAKDLKSFRVHSSLETITAEGARRSSNIVPRHSVLVLVRGMTLFKSVPVALTTREVAFNQDVKALVPNPGVNGIFLAYAVAQQETELLNLVSSAGHGTGRITSEDLQSLAIWLPPLPEQRRIAAVLDAWDDAIATTERLIAAKRRRKNALMQRVLGNANPVPLTDVADVAFSGVDKKIVADEQRVRLCNYMDVLNNVRLTDDISFSNGSANATEIARFSLREGDVIFTKDSETAEDIAEVAVVAGPLRNVICGYHLAVARPHAGVAGGRYLAHAMRTPEVRMQFVQRVNGVVRFGLTLHAVSEVLVPVPALEEQRAIAGVLDAADDEVQLLSKMTGRLRLQKRGLMQKLLTGEWRVPESVEALMPGGQLAGAAEAAE